MQGTIFLSINAGVRVSIVIFFIIKIIFGSITTKEVESTTRLPGVMAGLIIFVFSQGGVEYQGSKC